MKRKTKVFINKMFDHLIGLLGEDNAGLIIAIMCDLLDKFVEDQLPKEMRALTVTLNDFKSIRYDFEKGEATVLWTKSKNY